MSRRVVRGVVASLSIVVAWAGTAPAQAWAQEPPPESPPAAFVSPPPGYEPPPPPSPDGRERAEPRSWEQDPPPSFITLDRMDGYSRAGLQLGFHKFDGAGLGGDGFTMRFNPHVQFVLPNRVVGVYGQLPIARTFDSPAGDATGFGNFEMGAFFLPMRNSELILRAGFMAATASDSGADFFANVSSAYERMTDILLVIPNYTTLRLSASTIQQSGIVFVRLDGGFDLVIDRPSDDNDPSVFFRANVAAGIRAGGADLAIELVNLAFVNGDADNVS